MDWEQYSNGILSHGLDQLTSWHEHRYFFMWLGLGKSSVSTASEALSDH